MPALAARAPEATAPAADDGAKRRRSPRAYADPDTVLTVVMRDGDDRVVGRGRLHDLSATGAGVLVPVRIAQRIRALQQVRLSLPLSQGGVPLELAGTTRFVRRALPPGADGFGAPVLHLGIQFDADTPEVQAASMTLSAWIEARLATGQAPAPLRPAADAPAR